MRASPRTTPRRSRRATGATSASTTMAWNDVNAQRAPKTSALLCGDTGGFRLTVRRALWPGLLSLMRPHMDRGALWADERASAGALAGCPEGDCEIIVGRRGSGWKARCCCSTTRTRGAQRDGQAALGPHRGHGIQNSRRSISERRRCRMMSSAEDTLAFSTMATTRATSCAGID